ncbi:MAG: hypothetical protein ABIV43_01465 [Candidatus Saccharimonadales bacterium]
MKRFIYRAPGISRIAVLSLVLLATLATALSTDMLRVSAADAGPGNGLRVDTRKDATIQPGEYQTVTINVTNVTGASSEFQTIVNDFVANPDESGNPAIILDPTKFAPSHSLKRFIVKPSNFTLAPGEEKNIPITIKVPANAAGGGYYGVVRFAPAKDNSQPSQVSLAGSVGTLILVKVPGDIKEQLNIAGISVLSGKNSSNFFTTNKNLVVRIRFQNQGNIQETPFGKLIVKDRSNKVLGTYELNNISPPANVLPDSIRRFEIPIKTGKFGQYKIEGNFGYGSSGQLLSAATTIYIIPFALIVAFISLVVFLALAIFGVPRLIRAYNRRILRRAGRR